MESLMRLLVITMFLMSTKALADDRTEARIGPTTQNTPNLAAATADQMTTKPSKKVGLWMFPGSWSGAYEADSGVTSAPDTIFYKDAFRQRFLAGALYTRGLLKAELKLSVYAYDGMSDVDATRARVQPIDLHKAYVQYRSPVGLWRLGANESKWGLGLVAGGRSAYPTLTHHYHFETPADTTAGVAYALKLGAWTLALNGAFVLSDENAVMLDGDRAQQGVLVLRYQPKVTQWIGVYGAYRRQRDADDSRLEVLLIDLAAGIERPVGAADRIRLAFEAAYLQGQTDRSLSEAAFAAGKDQMDLQAYGAAAIAGLETMNRRLAVELEGGYASADRQPEDTTLTRFTFDNNYRVGMILLPSLLRYSHETSVNQSSDTSRVGQPQRGIERLKTQGRLAGATYLNLRSSFRMSRGKTQTGAHAGIVLAALPDGSADAYQSFRQGRPVNAFGEPSSSALGIEINTALTWSARLQRRYALRLSLEGAAAQPGSALSAGSSDPILMVRTGFILRALEREVN